jgi:hypothetical protein
MTSPKTPVLNSLRPIKASGEILPNERRIDGRWRDYSRRREHRDRLLLADCGPGAMIAEGSISGSEDVMRRIKKASAAKLALVDGPTLTLRCHGGRSGVRWVKALRP